MITMTLSYSLGSNMRKKQEAAAAKTKSNKVHPIDESKQALIDKPSMSFDRQLDSQIGLAPGLKKRSKAQNLVNKVKAANRIKPRKESEQFEAEEHQLKKSPQKKLDLEADPFGWDQVQAPVIENTLNKKEKNFETLTNKD